MIDVLRTQVGHAMSPVRFTVTPSQKLEEVAGLFCEHQVNMSPVVDSAGKCVGIITSSDLVRFQSQAGNAYSRIDHGMSFELTGNHSKGSLELVPHPFDEVQRQMTSAIQTVAQTCSLELASKIMCEQHIHHLVILDDSDRPVGILSSLDVLEKLNRC